MKLWSEHVSDIFPGMVKVKTLQLKMSRQLQAYAGECALTLPNSVLTSRTQSGAQAPLIAVEISVIFVQIVT